MFRFLSLLVLFLGASATHAAPLADTPEAVTPILIGAHAPSVSVRTLDGQAKPLAGALAGKPSIVVFYRGSWCPFCNLQLSQLNGIQDQLAALGYQILAITPDGAPEITKTLDKHALKYTIYSDPAFEAITAFGVGYRIPEETVRQYHANGVDLPHAPGESAAALPVPSVFIFDANGILQFTYVNPDYRIRLSSELLLAAAKASLRVKPLQPKR
jgi:peroxiredoxin